MRKTPLILLIVASLIGTAAVAVVLTRSKPKPVIEAIQTPSPSPSPTPSPSPSHSPKPKPTPKPSPKPVAATHPRVRRPVTADIAAFRGVATWIDAYDYGTMDPSTEAKSMAGHGVRAIFLQTGRYSLPGYFKNSTEMGQWIDAAHANGLKIVGWYLPGYGNMTRDVDRTAAIATFRSSSGQRFDGLAIDIEDKCEIRGSTCDKIKPSPTLTEAAWNVAVVTHLTRVRAAVGPAYAIASIVPAPLGMAIRPEHWTGFPWRGIPGPSDVIIPMSYWSFRDDCSTDKSHCAYGYTKGDIDEVHRLTSDASIAIHSAGGIADNITTAQVSDFVRASRESGAIGGSLYDYATMKQAYWTPLAALDR